MIRKGASVTRETTDFVGPEETSDNKLVPDAAFIMENIETQKRALFFVEMDIGTEPISSRIPRNTRDTIRHKLLQYDRYLQSLRYTQKYADYGEFRYFTLLFVTMSDTRVDNIRRETADLPAELAGYYRLTTFEQAMTDFLGPIWLNRAYTDTNRYALVREGTTS